ncbi:MAG: hypothetical protein O2798_09640 [Chloroflexi bacterium]|nr:hypothetical protein [Chloroflexota bacterium]MDA1241090.1 hypothetical protein [Chloroflexota bacterium]
MLPWTTRPTSRRAYALTITLVAVLLILSACRDGDGGRPSQGDSWPAVLGVEAVDEALASLRAGDAAALIALVPPMSVACTTEMGAGGPPKCPPDVAAGTVIEQIPYFECDGWGSAEGARDRLTGGSAYPLVVAGWTSPGVLALAGDIEFTHAVVMAREGYGAPDPSSDARLLTTLIFDDTALRGIIGDCGAYSESAFQGGALPPLEAGSSVLWRAYPDAP